MDIDALKKICHEEKLGQPGWYFVHRNISIRITSLLLPFDIRPNQISVLMILVGLAGGLLIGCKSAALNLAGLLVLYLSFLLDKVDGEIARYKKAFSVNGIVIDWLYHRIFIFAVYLGLCLKVFMETGGNLFVYGILSAFFAVLIEDNQFVSYIVYAQKLYKKRFLFQTAVPGKKTFIRSLFEYARIMKVFRTNLTLIYMLIPLYGAAFCNIRAVEAFIYLSLGVNAVYFIIQSAGYFSYKRVEELKQIDGEMVSFLEGKDEKSSFRSE